MANTIWDYINRYVIRHDNQTTRDLDEQMAANRLDWGIGPSSRYVPDSPDIPLGDGGPSNRYVPGKSNPNLDTDPNRRAMRVLAGEEFPPPRSEMYPESGSIDYTGIPDWVNDMLVRDPYEMLKRPAGSASPSKPSSSSSPDAPITDAEIQAFGGPRVYSPGTPPPMDTGKAPAPKKDPQKAMYEQQLEQMRMARSLFEQMMPKPPSQQEAYKDYEKKQEDMLARRQRLANIAIYSGIMEDAGYKGMARGYREAMGMHDQGYADYLKVMEGAASRRSADNTANYNRDLEVTKMAWDYSSGLAEKQAELSNMMMKRKQQLMDNYFSNEAKITEKIGPEIQPEEIQAMRRANLDGINRQLMMEGFDPLVEEEIDVTGE